MQFVNFVNSAIHFTKEYIMPDPKQLYLFNYMDKEYDDMESDDYDEAYADYLFDHADDIDSNIDF